MKVALVYDRVNKIGGAERVLGTLHELFPNAPLYTAVYDPKGAPWARVFHVIPSFINRIPFARRHHEFFPWLTPLAFQSFDFSAFDLVISVTSAEAKNIHTPPPTVHLCYCLTPTRYLWSGFATYARDHAMLSFFFRLWAPVLKHWDLNAARRPDRYVAISNRVRQRIETYYMRKADCVIYPPVETSKFTKKKQTKKGTYYLFVSRLVPYKRADIVIAACNRLHLPLVVIGCGSEYQSLQKMASPSVQFITKYLTDSELLGYYQNCRAFLFAGDEDFGIVAAEAQSAGKPVIAYRESGVAEIVVDGKTGVLYDEQTPDGLMRAITKFETLGITESACRRQAEKFSVKRFKEEMTAYINKMVNQV
ncbi:MAG: glycosyltransferase [Microgenomates group bacterium]